MKKFLALAVFTMSFSAMSNEQPKHMISFGTDGFGWSGLGTVYKWDKEESGVKDHTASQGKISLNYNYVFPNRVMLGGEIVSETSKSEIKPVTGTKITAEDSDTRIGISLGYNFNEDLFRSWWIKGTLGSGNFESESEDSDGKDTFDFKYGYFTFSAGKRFSFESWGIKNLSYSPSISITGLSVSGDAEDAGLDSVSVVQLDILKFDLLF